MQIAVDTDVNMIYITEKLVLILLSFCGIIVHMKEGAMNENQFNQGSELSLL